MTTLLNTKLGKIQLTFMLLIGCVGIISAQSSIPTDPKVFEVPAVPSELTKPSVPSVPVTVNTNVDKATTSVNPIKTTAPTTAGKWVKRVSYKKCPNGSEPYVANDGGVRCWVNDK